jgi:actin-related protein
MFEYFDVPAFYISNGAVLSLYSNGGRTTGIVCDSGKDCTYSVPIFNGFSIKYAV